jgi:hypothetical protein
MAPIVVGVVVLLWWLLRSAVCAGFYLLCILFGVMWKVEGPNKAPYVP